MDYATAAQAVRAADTAAGALADIARYPDLRLAVVAHPNVYPALLDWLEVQGDAGLTQAVARRRASLAPVAPVPVAPVPVAPAAVALAPVLPGSAVPPPPGAALPPRSALPPSPGAPVPPGPYPAGPYPPGQYPPGPYPAGSYPPGPYPPGPGVPPPGYPYGYGPPTPSGGPGVTLASAKAGVWRAFETMTGGEGATVVRFRDLFRDTWRKHSKTDIDALIYSGTGSADHRPRLPWLYLRVFGLLFGSFLVMWLCYAIFHDSAGNLVPGVIFLGALAVPATVMIFFWEIDQSRLISLFDILRFFFLGAAFSLMLTFLIDVITYAFVPGDQYGVGTALAEAIAVGLAEEIAKMVVVFFLIRKLVGLLVSNGLLVGAIVGAGFAVFETMGYGLSAWSNGSLEWTLFLRGVLSLGGHVAWAAISGAAIMLAQRPGTPTPSLKALQPKKFLALFAVPVVLHILWDFFAFLAVGVLADLLLAGLVVVAWVFLVRLINSGLRQYAGLVDAAVGV